MDTRIVEKGGSFRVASLVAILLLPSGSNRVLAQSSQQTPKKSPSAQSVPLTPQEKEAQKHYRIALEAIKNNDFSTASDELKAAAELAPKNALIWYNLAVVESKNGDSAPALEHLQKAETLGLPKTLRNDADQLDAKLSYEAKRRAKLQSLPTKLQELEAQVNEGAHTRHDPVLPSPGQPQHNFETCDYELTSQSVSQANLVWNMHDIRDVPDPDHFGFHIDSHYYGSAHITFADFAPDVQILENQKDLFCGPYFAVVKTETPKFFKATNGHQGVCAPQSAAEPRSAYYSMCQSSEPTETDQTEVSIGFPKKELAEAAAKTLSELIRMSREAH